MTHPALERNNDAFNLQLYRAAQEAARLGVPVCPVRFDEIVQVDEVFYGVNWTSRGTASKTMKLDAMVISLETGRSFGFEDIIRKVRNGSAQYSLARRGTWTGRAAASHALAELAVRHTQAPVLHNPVTAPVFVGVSA